MRWVHARRPGLRTSGYSCDRTSETNRRGCTIEDLTAFCAAQHPRVLAMLVMHVGDRWTAEELAQDVLVRVASNWSKVARMDTPAAWVSRVTVNVANSALRRRYAARRAAAGMHERPVHTDTTDVLAVRDAVRTLPQRQRTALVLKVWGGQSHAEAAAVMGIAEGTSRALVHQAMTTLRETFGVAISEGTSHV